MIRTLAMVALAGFVVAAASLAGAVAITGPEAVAHGAWSWGPGGWGHGGDGPGPGREASGDVRMTTSRQIAWDGADPLVIALQADVTLRSAPGPASLSVSGPAQAVEKVAIQDGEVRYASDADDRPRLTVTVQAPTLPRVILRRGGEVAWEEGPAGPQPSARP